MDLVAPAGTPIRSSDISYWFSSLISNRDTIEEFRQAICQKFSIKHCLFMSSGRAALSLIVNALSEIHGDKNKDEIIVPSYTCYSVPGSVIKAGLKIRVCDIDPATLSYDIRKLANFDFTRVLAIATANLYGIPNDLPRICEIARANNVYVIDDAAQCMGGKVSGQYSGTFGDVGLYSLDKGKNITSIQGGIIVTNSDDLAQVIDQKIKALPKPSMSSTITESIKLLAYSAILPPKTYWITRYMPFLNLGKTVYTTEYPVQQYNSNLAGVALSLFYRLDTLSTCRSQNAQNLEDGLCNLPGIEFIRGISNAESVDIRLPVLVADGSARQRILRLLLDRGISASYSYPLAVPDIPEIKHLLHHADINQTGGQRVAREILTLPTHPYVTNKHIEIITEIIRLVSEGKE